MDNGNGVFSDKVNLNKEGVFTGQAEDDQGRNNAEPDDAVSKQGTDAGQGTQPVPGDGSGGMGYQDGQMDHGNERVEPNLAEHGQAGREPNLNGQQGNGNGGTDQGRNTEPDYGVSGSMQNPAMSPDYGTQGTVQNPNTMQNGGAQGTMQTPRAVRDYGNQGTMQTLNASAGYGTSGTAQNPNQGFGYGANGMEQNPNPAQGYGNGGQGYFYGEGYYQYPEQGGYEREMEIPVTVGEWLIYMLLMLIPCVNIVLMLVWTFGDKEKKSKSNYFKARLIFYGIMIGLSFLWLIFYGFVLLLL